MSPFRCNAGVWALYAQQVPEMTLAVPITVYQSLTRLVCGTQSEPLTARWRSVPSSRAWLPRLLAARAAAIGLNTPSQGKMPTRYRRTEDFPGTVRSQWRGDTACGTCSGRSETDPEGVAQTSCGISSFSLLRCERNDPGIGRLKPNSAGRIRNDRRETFSLVDSDLHIQDGA